MPGTREEHSGLYISSVTCNHLCKWVTHCWLLVAAEKSQASLVSDDAGGTMNVSREVAEWLLTQGEQHHLWCN